MSAPRILVIDDGHAYIDLFHALLRDYAYATRCELSGPCWECPHRGLDDAAMARCELTHAHDWAETELALARHSDLDVALLDMRFELPEERLLGEEGSLEVRRRRQGLLILERLRARRPSLPVILMTSRDDVDAAAADALDADEWVRFAGADAFDARALSLLVERILARGEGSESDFFWGPSASMQRLQRDARALGPTSLPILIRGETGTGKSALAEKVLHPRSGRSGRFVAVDLSAIPESLVAAELFGSTRGAYSGAVDRAGRFEDADKGTLFLDEIGNLGLDVQRMLLLALQDARITRLGEGQPRSVDVKLIAATHVDLEEAVRNGRFRADLYARLNPAARLELPPLRDRIGDLEALAERFVEGRFRAGPDRTLLARYLEAAGLRTALRARLRFEGVAANAEGVTFAMPRASLRSLRAHDWPGNIRELELLVASAALMALGDALEAAERGRSAPLAQTIPIPAKLVARLLGGSWVRRPAARRGRRDEALERRHQLRDVVRDLERRLLIRLFHQHDGDFEAIAGSLLLGEPSDNARRVRMRFNQLGLKARALRTRYSE